MELAHYGRFLRRYAGLVVAVAVLVAGVAGIVAASQPTQSQATGAVLLKIRDTRPLAEYDYDQYYVVQSTDLYATNVVSWLNSSQVKDDIKRTAGDPEGSIRGKKNGGTIELTATADQPGPAAALVKAASDLVVQRTTQLSAGPSRSSFEAVPSGGAANSVEPRPVRNAGIGFVAGLLLGLVIALAAEAARPARKR